jgi:propionate CoA-transferase
VKDGNLRIYKEGKVRKFVRQVEHVTFSGTYAQSKKQPVFYVTERCVFSLTEEGMVLSEVAPGIDIEKDILALMDFRPVIKGTPQLMDERIFRPEPMDLKKDLLALTLEERLTYDPAENLFFVNFEGFSVKTGQQVREIKDAVSHILSPLGKKVYTIVNYDNFSIAPDLVDEYTEMVKDVVDRFYTGVSRYTTSTFLRMKLGDALKKRDVAPYIFESSDEARRALGKE